ncbi:helix-turn-helix domain-containing protein [Arthrobacter sulfonylureivorans]|uniref:helix-turn-helix domain-containing protein n=1 Tax=Arthrobacter sulfonylureivorans TaxID=2486855 RepID=UPI0039E4EE35
MSPSPSADLILHPVRLRIVQSLLGERELTTAEISAELPDVPTATLYRHIGTLAKAGVLAVTQERPVRGTTERTYRLDATKSSVEGDDLASMTAEDHRRGFMAFAAGLLDAFDQYTARDTPDLVRDGAGYRQTALWMTDEELTEFSAAIRAAAQKAAPNGPGEGRHRRLFSTVLIPADPPA